MKFRPEADIWPLMSDDELRKLAADIDENGQKQPILLYEGDILDGRNRWLAITRHCPGREPKFETVNPGSPIRYVVSLNEKRRHLNDSQRAMAASKALPFYEAEAKKRQHEAAQKASHAAAKKRTKLSKQDSPSASIEAQGEPAKTTPLQPRRATKEAAESFATSDGSVQRAKRVQNRGSQKLNEAVERGELSLGKADEILKLYPDEDSQDAQVANIRQSRMVTRAKGLTGEIEWYTPREYLDAAVAVMGDIDLDPASSELAQEHVQAHDYFTLEKDGLEQTWFGRVFLNPPYAMPTVKNFVTKLVESYQAGDIEEGILLTNNATDTEWFHLAVRACSAVCFTRGRIHFIEARNGEMVQKASPTHGQAFCYFGPKNRTFVRVFSQYGTVLYRIDEEAA